MADLGNLSPSEEARIPGIVLEWLNTCGMLPAGPIRYQILPVGIPGMCMTSTRATYVSRRYIYGGYLAHFHILLIYRIQPGGSSKQRLKADETLNAIGNWAVDPANQASLFGGACAAHNLYILYRANLANAYDNGDEDHSITITLTYEVIKPL